MPPEVSAAPAPVPVAISRALVKLSEIDDGSEHAQTRIRVTMASGASVTGRLFDLRATRLTIVEDATGGLGELEVGDIRMLEVEMPRRAAEWAFAALGIIVAILALAAYALLPWVQAKNEGHMMFGFFILYGMTAPIFGLAMRRTRLGRWLKQWRTLYPDEHAT